MTEIEAFFQETLKRFQLMNETIAAADARLLAMGPRFESASAQIKRNLPQRDGDLEEDFNRAAKELYDFANDSEEFWTKTRDALRSFNKKELAENHGFDIKSLGIQARALTRSIEKISSSMVFVARATRGSNLKLNAWMTENAVLSFDKLASKILFMTRELSKNMESGS